MCDYSLHSVKSRPAKVDDRLVSTRFTNSITHGFAPVGEPEVAVCLLAGTEVAFDNDVTYRRGWGLFRNGRLAEKVAQFRQIDMDKPAVHHDALEFPNGKVVLVNNLCEGQRVTVLQLPASPRAATEAAKQGDDSLVS